ncbi:unnamed protein product [Colias eurytheme]|nr:unnamed protein product [Colias eurytheme]
MKTLRFCKWKQDRQWNVKYMECGSQLKKAIRRAKRQHLDGLIQNMETFIRAGESRKFYKEVKTTKKGYQPTTQILEDVNGDLITDSEDIKMAWRDYFQSLLNCPPPQAEIIRDKDDNYEDVPPPTFAEVHKAIMRLKNNKAPGIDGVPSEVWKQSGAVVQSKLYEVLRKIWEEQIQPKDWNTGIICPVHKKGSKKKCSNYRGIALLPTAYKILSYILLDRLEPYAEKILSDYQCGFRRNRSTIDQIFLIKQIMEKRWEYSQSMHALFVDFEKAYDSIDRGALFAILKELGIPIKLVDLIKVAIGESSMHVRVGKELTEGFAVFTGLKQDSSLSQRRDPERAQLINRLDLQL